MRDDGLVCAGQGWRKIIIAIGNTKGGKCSSSDGVKIAFRLDLLHDIDRPYTFAILKSMDAVNPECFLATSFGSFTRLKEQGLAS